MQTQEFTIEQFELGDPSKRKQSLKHRSERKRTQSEFEMTAIAFKKDPLLSINKSFIHRILNLTPNIFCIYSLSEKRHIYVNPAITAILGYPTHQIQEMPTFFTSKLCHPDDITRLEEHLQKCASLQENEIIEINFRLKNYQGEWRWLRWRDTVFSKNKNGQIQAILGTAEDITDRVKAEQEIKQALAREQEINQVKSNFISTLSHDLRTPLTIILGAAKILKNLKCEPTIKPRMFAMIEQAVKQANNLISDVLVLGTTESGQIKLNPTRFDLASFINSIVAQLQISTGRKNLIVCANANEKTTVKIDEKMLTQILVNLLDNAIKYSPQDTPIYLRYSNSPEEVIIQIEDRGLGILPEEKRHIFEYFRRGSNVRRITGTGLGLAIVKQCLEMQKGAIEVDSEVGRGTIVTVKIPNFQ